MKRDVWRKLGLRLWLGSGAMGMGLTCGENFRSLKNVNVIGIQFHFNPGVGYGAALDRAQQETMICLILWQGRDFANCR